MKEDRIYLLNALKELKEKGYSKAIVTPEDGPYLYAFITTPKDNVIYIQRGDFNMGWTFSLKYKPSRATGNGCACFEEPVFELNQAIIEKAETEGLNFARKLKATLYKTSGEFYTSYWDTNKMEEV